MSVSAVDCKTQPLFPPGTCPRCGSHSHVIGEGRGPHYASILCQNCGRFIRWVPKPQTPLLTAVQRAYLAELGHQGPMPTTQEAGRRLIAAYLTGERW